MAVAVTHSTPADGTFSPEGQAAWDAEHGITGLSTVAGTGSYNDLTDKPTIPTVPESPVAIEVDFGTKPVYDATFTITDAAITALSNVSAQQSGKVATGRVAGDSAWDAINCAVLPAAGSAVLYCTASPGPVVGRRIIQYQVSN